MFVINITTHTESLFANVKLRSFLARLKFSCPGSRLRIPPRCKKNQIKGFSLIFSGNFKFKKFQFFAPKTFSTLPLCSSLSPPSCPPMSRPSSHSGPPPPAPTYPVESQQTTNVDIVRAFCSNFLTPVCDIVVVVVVVAAAVAVVMAVVIAVVVVVVVHVDVDSKNVIVSRNREKSLQIASSVMISSEGF